MNKFMAWFKKQTTSKKIQFAAALLLTFACIISYPIFAWFTHKRELKMASYINAPINLYITATHLSENPGINLGDIDIAVKVDEDKPTYKNYVFCVRNINIDDYILQLAHTTNNPFTYEIYAAEYIENPSEDVKESENVVIYTENDITFVYEILYGRNLLSEAYGGRTLNASVDSNGKVIATKIPFNSKADISYEDYAHIQQNALPLYHQTEAMDELIPDKENRFTNKDNGEQSDYFILRVRWEKGLENNKETDVIYITAGSKTQTSQEPQSGNSD